MYYDKLALGLLETTGYTPAMVALDEMEKSGNIRVLQAELNDFLGVIIKIAGPPADVQNAISAGYEIARRLRGEPVRDVILKPHPSAWPAIESAAEFNPLIQQNVVHEPTVMPGTSEKESPQALGFIETQGFTAVFDAIDTACKTAGVEVVGKEKLGGGFVTVVIRGDVAAVTTAIEAGQAQVEGLGKLIAAHVIPRPSEGVLSLLPGN